jgi:hypothetical protein
VPVVINNVIRRIYYVNKIEWPAQIFPSVPMAISGAKESVIEISAEAMELTFCLRAVNSTLLIPAAVKNISVGVSSSL